MGQEFKKMGGQFDFCFRASLMAYPMCSKCIKFKFAAQVIGVSLNLFFMVFVWKLI